MDMSFPRSLLVMDNPYREAGAGANLSGLASRRHAPPARLPVRVRRQGAA